MLEVRHLEIVDAIARAGSVTAAARRLHLTQPALSHALGDLESRLGVDLFVREPRGMTLTDEGKRVLAAASVVLDTIREAEHDLRQFRDGYQGVLRISTECYTCYHWLPPILAHLHERFPGVDLQIAAEVSYTALEAMAAGAIDLALVHSAVKDPGLVTEELFEDELVAALPPGHPLAGRPWLEAADFSDRVLILHTDPEHSILWKRFLAPAGARPSRVVVLRLTEAVLESVKAGLGITVMPSWTLRPTVDAGELVTVKVGEKGLFRSWRLVTRREIARRAHIQELTRLIKEGGAMVPGGARGGA